jgi:hypothetical protein
VEIILISFGELVDQLAYDYIPTIFKVRRLLLPQPILLSPQPKLTIATHRVFANATSMRNGRYDQLAAPLICGGYALQLKKKYVVLHDELGVFQLSCQATILCHDASP